MLIGFAVLGAVIAQLAPRQERTLEAKFGDVYREYKRRVPRVERRHRTDNGRLRRGSFACDGYFHVQARVSFSGSFGLVSVPHVATNAVTVLRRARNAAGSRCVPGRSC